MNFFQFVSLSFCVRSNPDVYIKKLYKVQILDIFILAGVYVFRNISLVIHIKLNKPKP